MDALEKLRSLGQSAPSLVASPSEEDVRNAEEKLGVKFPPSFITYQLEYADLTYGSFEPYLRIEDGSHLDLVNSVSEARAYGLPQHLLPFVEDNGDYYCFDLATKAPEYKVRYWSHDGATDESWESFLDWVETCWIGEESQ
ncbi:MAG TPA: SMI1/KNR4 family protein [Flavisolibacter sp.]|jgi:hypothetical protein|nr:SMI1/KNR4 family protein [Flavisolibacter sp.]